MDEGAKLVVFDPKVKDGQIIAYGDFMFGESLATVMQQVFFRELKHPMISDDPARGDAYVLCRV